ncbi:TetR/AcrR family transcriptional regulator [Streptomyces sp. NPDC058469]|uniref:TetR/AcrR family transcriptional regulator n=1 Tax=Streptomyces sp. NPDC058469 TaxID=3346514 RepID=UPI00365C19D6
MGTASAGTGAGNGRARSRRGQGAQLRREIVAGVQHLLAEWGSADQLTMRAVAKEVGISAPSIYLHFADKTELVWAALADRYDELVAQMTRAGADAGDDPRERLRAQAHAYCLFAMSNPGHYRLMFEVRQPAVEPSRINGHPARHVSASFRTALRGCLESGYALSLPVEQAAQTLWAALHGTVALHHSLYHDESSETLTLHLADGVVDSLVTGTPGTSPHFPSAPPDSEASRQIRDLLSPPQQ